MKILVVSDTHRRLENLKTVLERVQPVDLLLHMGDAEGDEDYIAEMAGCPMAIVAGNNDFFSTLPRERELEIGKYRIFMTHGHYYDVNSGTMDLKKEARFRRCDIAMFGHTHRPVIEYGDEVVVINPGSLTHPRQEGRRPSFILMNIDRVGKAHFEINYL